MLVDFALPLMVTLHHIDWNWRNPMKVLLEVLALKKFERHIYN